MNEIKQQVLGAVQSIRSEAEAAARDQLSQRVTSLETAVQERMARVVQRGATQESLDKFAGINEEEILSFVPDKRDFAGLGPFFFGLVLLSLLPGYAKIASLPFFFFAVGLFLLGYVFRAKVDVPDGFEGVICRFGSPIDGPAGRARKGRNWFFGYARFIPFLVSSRDQVVNLKNGNFTWDFGSIALGNQVVFRIEDPARFISRTTPAGIMKLLNLYASYITLRMITSMRDARVKFTGRDRIDNVIHALNEYLAQDYGIRVIRANMPTAENDIISDLEAIRTQLKKIDALSEDKQVKLESAIKEVESRMRKARKETRSKALELQHAKISMETNIAEEVNTLRQALLIDARKRLEGAISQLKREIASVRAKLEKAKAIQQSFAGLEAQVELRKAAVKRRIFGRMIPKQVNILGVSGIGPGIGLSLGQQLFHAMDSQLATDTPPPGPPPVPRRKDS
jgi:hypothetical protein